MLCALHVLWGTPFALCQDAGETDRHPVALTTSLPLLQFTGQAGPSQGIQGACLWT